MFPAYCSSQHFIPDTQFCNVCFTIKYLCSCNWMFYFSSQINYLWKLSCLNWALNNCFGTVNQWRHFKAANPNQIASLGWFCCSTPLVVGDQRQYSRTGQDTRDVQLCPHSAKRRTESKERQLFAKACAVAKRPLGCTGVQCEAVLVISCSLSNISYFNPRSALTRACISATSKSRSEIVCEHCSWGNFISVPCIDCPLESPASARRVIGLEKWQEILKAEKARCNPCPSPA